MMGDMNPADKPRPDLRVVGSHPLDRDTDRPADDRDLGPDGSIGAAVDVTEEQRAAPPPLPPLGKIKPTAQQVAVVQPAARRSGLYLRLGGLSIGSAVTTYTAVVAGWWVLIGPTVVAPPPAPETIVRVERVEVPVPSPAPPPEVVYVQVPAAPAPARPAVEHAAPPPAPVAPPVEHTAPPPPVTPPVATVATPPPVVVAPPAPKAVAPAAAIALNGAYAGRAGSWPASFDLAFLPEGAVRAIITIDEDGSVVTNTVTGRYGLGPDGAATVALIVGDLAYSGVVSDGKITGRVSQGGKSRGKLNAQR